MSAPTDPWWATQCGKRAPGLTHSRGENGKCRDCGQTPPVTPPVPLDVQHRLRELGLVPSDAMPEDGSPPAPAPELPGEPDPDTKVPREPKFVTGEVDGPAYGRGRSWRGDGDLSTRDKQRLEDVLYREKKHGYR